MTYSETDLDDSCRICGNLHGGHGNCPNHCSEHDHSYDDDACPVCWAKETIESATSEQLEALIEDINWQLNERLEKLIAWVDKHHTCSITTGIECSACITLIEDDKLKKANR